MNLQQPKTLDMLSGFQSQSAANRCTVEQARKKIPRIINLGKTKLTFIMWINKQEKSPVFPQTSKSKVFFI